MNNNKKDSIDPDEYIGNGFSKDQVLQLSSKNMEDLHLMENSDSSGVDKKDREEEIEKAKQKDHPNPNDGGPRPPKEEEFPDDEEEELFSEVSDPEKKE